MQMSISQAAPAVSQAQPGGNGTKGTAPESNGFDQTLEQTISGVLTTTGQSQAPVTGEAAAIPINANALTGLLGSNFTAADLLKAIEELLKKLDSQDDPKGDSAVSENDMADTLKQLDELLALLGMPVLQQPAADPANVNPADENAGQASIDSNTAIKLSEAVQTGLAQQSAALIPKSLSSPEEQSGHNKEVMTALKFGLQDALMDLRSFLQQGRGGKVTLDQLDLIGKQLTQVKQMLDGVMPQRVKIQHAAVPNVESADAMPNIQTTQASNSHLHRMANQLLHVGLLKVLPSKQETVSADKPAEELAASSSTAVPIAGSQEQQRQIHPVKIAAPIPVQQFAETMQSLVAKQFNVSSVNGVSEARISLFPEHLGQVDVRITVHNGQLTALFLTDTTAAKDILENQMAQLRSSLQSQGLQVDKLEVSQTTVQTSMFQDRQGHGGREQQADKRNKSESDTLGEVTAFDVDLEGKAAEQAVDRRMGLGRGIHTLV
ncbi:flagellar hook-length control protein FliK [Paenibacillus sp. sptzw28]|uniref:flagellar hook-length control protein FliK n=1 Tax=Paenibacillus sp. sptzw28 TaxID=715179 RepID=UPI001C6F3FAB|nr:flagellar hook-length control protein FliK [Paenibacillus sp. sptzw28]QYR19770.1 flagellar hook-length control protein FliK [Paenibacillus sp. sptzw28]